MVSGWEGDGEWVGDAPRVAAFPLISQAGWKVEDPLFGRRTGGEIGNRSRFFVLFDYLSFFPF